VTISSPSSTSWFAADVDADPASIQLFERGDQGRGDQIAGIVEAVQGHGARIR
jgi:hypothetical protein